MKKLVIFGDSFGCADIVFKEYCIVTWPALLSTDLGVELLNYSIAGTGAEYALCKFYEYLTSNNYDESDSVIFILSSVNRVTVQQSIESPRFAEAIGLSFFSRPRDPKARLWYEDNKEHLQWLLKTTPHEVPYIREHAYLLLVKSLLDMYFVNRSIVLPAFDLLKYQKSIPLAVPGRTAASNMPKVVEYPISLNTISRMEFVDGATATAYFKQYFCDFRLGHLTDKNHSIVFQNFNKILRGDDSAQLPYITGSISRSILDDLRSEAKMHISDTYFNSHNFKTRAFTWTEHDSK